MLVYLLVRDVYLNCLCASSMCSDHSLVSVFISTPCHVYLNCLSAMPVNSCRPAYLLRRAQLPARRKGFAEIV